MFTMVTLRTLASFYASTLTLSSTIDEEGKWDNNID